MFSKNLKIYKKSFTKLEKSFKNLFERILKNVLKFYKTPLEDSERFKKFLNF